VDAQIFGYIGAVLVSALAVPQLVKILRDRDAAGVSVPSWIMQALCCLTFLIYGLRISEMPQILGNVLPVIGALAIVVVALVARQQMSVGHVVLAVSATVAYVGLMFAIAPLAVGSLATLWAFIARWPQVVDSISASRQGIATSVSPATWYLMIAAMVSWMIYGIILMDIPVLATNVIGILASIVILIAEYRNPANRQSEADSADSPPAPPADREPANAGS
jgi:MtN3 and saliva related transmembrane protein